VIVTTLTLPTVLTALPLDQASAVPLYQQLYEGLRQAILVGQLSSGMKLPSTRFLSTYLRVSRNTVLNAFAQLAAEGYLESKHGSGTYVAQALPDEMLSISTDAPTVMPSRSPQGRQPSQRGAKLLAMAQHMPEASISLHHGKLRAFREGIPALDVFPRKIWERLLARQSRRSSFDLLNYGDCQPLSEAIAGYLGTARGVRCTTDQVIVVAGSQQGINLVAKVLLDPGDAAWVEDPGYPGAYGGLLGVGARTIPVPVDQEGLIVSAGVTSCPEARLAFVTPSHQFPLGVTMSLKRRLELLEWASQTDAWVLEDDYDSEYRYTGRPLAALQGIDRENRVIYLGTFSKVMFPALRLGYLVAPPDLVETFRAARKFAVQHPPLLEQLALADFISEGHFVRHIRRMRALYADRQAVLVEIARRELTGLLDVEPAESGMHLLGWLPDHVDDFTASQQAAAHEVDAAPLSTYSIEAVQPGALLLGYAGVDEIEIEAGIHRLIRALQ